MHTLKTIFSISKFVKKVNFANKLYLKFTKMKFVAVVLFSQHL